MLILIFLCLFPAYLSARNVNDIAGDTFEEVSGKGLEIHTNPAGVHVLINGVDEGYTPVDLEDIVPGVHYIKLSLQGYKDREFMVTVFNTSRLIISIEMEELRGLAQVVIQKAPGSPEALPLEPQIFSSIIQGIQDPVTHNHDSTTLLSLPVGYNTIRVRAFGWDDASVTVLVNQHTTVTANIVMRPAKLKLDNASQSRRKLNPLNPGNLGRTDFRFEVSAPGTGTIVILDQDRTAVFSRKLDQFNTWVQQITWNGRDFDGNLVPQGIYTVIIEAMNPEETVSLELETEIDYSIRIFPLSIESGIAGMLLAPMPHVLPAGSYQINANLLFGNFRSSQHSREEVFAFGFPFKLNMRISPLDQFELTTTFNINPYIENRTGWGVSGSAKYNILNGTGSVPLALSAGASYSWASKTGDYPLSPGKGTGLYTPLSLELSNFSIVFCPAAFWYGFSGFVPKLLLSGGVLYRGSWLTGGISARSELGFSHGSTRFLAGAEAQFFPPPSNLVYSIFSGIWTQDDKIGAYGGIGFGVIY